MIYMKVEIKEKKTLVGRCHFCNCEELRLKDVQKEEKVRKYIDSPIKPKLKSDKEGLSINQIVRLLYDIEWTSDARE